MNKIKLIAWIAFTMVCIMWLALGLGIIGIGHNHNDNVIYADEEVSYDSTMRDRDLDIYSWTDK